MPLALCACPRRIRVAPSVLAAGAIVCTVCEQPFSLPEQPTERNASASPVVVGEPWLM